MALAAPAAREMSADMESVESLADTLREAFGERLLADELMARHTSARVGGPAQLFLAVESGEELAQAARLAYASDAPFLVLGGGSNVLVADGGVVGLVILNKAKAVSLRRVEAGAVVRAESGCSLGALARQCVQAGYSGLEWAATVPGTVGGAVYGNAGAHGGDTASSLLLAEILQQDGSLRSIAAPEMNFDYRMSRLKMEAEISGPGISRAKRRPPAVVISAEFRLTRDDPARVQARVEGYVAQRKRTQPPGASLGSMFKNPPGDYAGRLIEAAGLKGTRIGGAEISTVHGNFFINLGEAQAADVRALLDLAQTTVRQKFGFEMEPEVELVGEWGMEG
jgi:UDP-N-acetylmuramate dehydrogenase